ncbi:MAG: GH3 auxin-responsive promoter family protein [Salinibacter sp.]|uniref:GH3 family domain-containing protein n=1 Tax=Salinibacter sp. TaxID=2065818 RepID=UPI002FC385A5
MSVFGRLIRRGLQLRSAFEQWRGQPAPIEQQRGELDDLLATARDTAFGRHYDFAAIRCADDPVAAFQDRVPVYEYHRMEDEWWHRTRAGEADVTWPGSVPYFARSSGTSGASSKYVPMTDAMVEAFEAAGMRQVYALPAFDPPDATFQKDVLFLGGSTSLTEEHGARVGDVSGISAAQLPAWFEYGFKKPGPAISALPAWEDRLEALVREAPRWDVGIVCGVPSWVQLLFQTLIDRYDADTIHDLWPHLSVFVHGGVSFDPYRRGFAELVDRPLRMLETYVASEAYIAFQPAPDRDMAIMFDNGVFYEFVPFTDANFTDDGQIRAAPTACTIEEVEPGTPYALLVSTCAGTWRYLIGDVVKFTDTDRGEIVVAGRTQHFLNLCGEHVSGANMTDALQRVEDKIGSSIPEFTVAGVPNGDVFAHHWYLGMEDPSAGGPNPLRDVLDASVRAVNDDYGYKRDGGVLSLQVTPVPVSLFYEWMERRGRMGGQNKVPRVMKEETLADWQSFLAARGVAGEG